MNKATEYTLYSIGAANLTAVAKLGMQTVGGLSWTAAFWVATVATLFAIIVAMSLTHGYEPIAKHAYDETEGLDHE